MKLISIDETNKVYPGEYVFHKPSSAIVMVGSYSSAKKTIRGFKDGSLFEDKVVNFRKIHMNEQEKIEYKNTRCSKCKGGKK